MTPSVIAKATPVTNCLSCGSESLQHVLDLGTQPLANNLLSEGDLSKEEPMFPLGMQVCRECWLMQLTHLVPAVDLFSDYLYFSSFSAAMLEHARLAADKYTREFGLTENSFVVEIASNDGYLLKNFVASKIPCLGIEPAANVAVVAREAGIETIERFFGEESSEEVASKYRTADLILGNNVFAHAPDTNDFVGGLKKLLSPKGCIVLEFPYAVDFLEKTEFDTIYHEHVFYFSLSALVPLFARHGLTIVDVEKLPIHGGSLRIFAQHEGASLPSGNVSNCLEAEISKGITQLETYDGFAGKVLEIRNDLKALLSELKASGHSIAAYGASAKGSTLLNFCGIGTKTLDFVVDRSDYKQGKYTAGLHIPIREPEVLLAENPDYALLLTWNFAAEILKQQKEYTESGGKFIIPIPSPKVLG